MSHPCHPRWWCSDNCSARCRQSTLAHWSWSECFGTRPSVLDWRRTARNSYLFGRCSMENVRKVSKEMNNTHCNRCKHQLVALLPSPTTWPRLESTQFETFSKDLSNQNKKIMVALWLTLRTWCLIRQAHAVTGCFKYWQWASNLSTSLTHAIASSFSLCSYLLCPPASLRLFHSSGLARHVLR